MTNDDAYNEYVLEDAGSNSQEYTDTTPAIQYWVVKASSIAELESEVAGFIADGWKPLGGIAAVDMEGVRGPSGENILTLLQALIKEA